MSDLPAGRPTIAFAHRGGFDGGHRENSLAAFADALGRGCQLESDLRLSLGGVPVLAHDAFSIRRGVPVATSLYPTGLLRRLDVPSLHDLYATLGTDFELSADLKQPRAWAPAVAVARAFGAVDRLWLVHDDLRLLRAIRAADPDVRLVHEARPQVLARRGEALEDHPARLAEAGIDAQNTRAIAWTPELVSGAHAAGIFAFGSMVQDPEAQRRAAAKGLDAIYTDNLTTLVDAISAVGRVARVGELGARRRFDAVLFDFGSTLFGHAPGPDVVATASTGLGTPLAPEAAAALWAEIDAAAMDPAERALGRDLDAEVWDRRWRVLYGLADGQVPGLGTALHEAFHGPDHWVPYADTERVLRTLHELGVPIGIVSNTGWDVRGPFAHRGLDRYVSTWALSYEVGAVKPDPRIFRAACDALGVAPERVLMVGDDRDADRGALEAGIGDLLLVDPATPLGADNGLAEVLTRVRP